MIDEKHIPLLIDKFPALDLSWPEAQITAWVTALGLILRGQKIDTHIVTREPGAPRARRQKPGPTVKAAPMTRSEAARARWAKAKAAAKDPALAAPEANKGGRPAGAEMCPGCHKMIKPAHLAVKVNDRSWHAECAPEE